MVVNTAFVGLCALFLSLGIWQLNRADEKRTMLEAESVAAAAPPVALESVLNDIAASSSIYKRITPLVTDTGHTVLINRGWVPVGLSRTELPDVMNGVNASGSVTVEGVMTRPSKGLSGGPAIEPSKIWPKRMQYLDYPALNALYGRDVVPTLVQGRLLGDPITEEWHLLGNWEPTPGFGPQRHLGYAVQWFGLLVTLVFLYLWYGVRLFRKPKRDEQP